MKFSRYILLILLLLPSIILNSQTVELKFTGKYYSSYVPIDSIYIENVTQGGDTLLYGMDTLLLLDYTTSLNDNIISHDFNLKQNYPNPFYFNTNFHIAIPETDQVTILVYDILGRRITKYDKTIQKGVNKFSYVSGKPGLFILKATYRNYSQSLKIYCISENTSTGSKINYLGTSSLIVMGKSSKAKSGFNFIVGDHLKAIGYYHQLSDTHLFSPMQDTMIVFSVKGVNKCPTTFIDLRDSNNYTAVQIGTQCWMSRNLSYLPKVNPPTDWSNYNPFYYVYDYYGTDVQAAKATTFYQIFGVLYNWYAMMDSSSGSNIITSGIQGVCPHGWHLPSNEEWKVLEGEVDNTYGYPDTTWNNNGWRGTDAGGNMKENGTALWFVPNTNGTNSSGFTALPGGEQMYNSGGIFRYIGSHAYFWSCGDTSNNYAWFRSLEYDKGSIRMDYTNYSQGFSVRCIMDTCTYAPTTAYAGLDTLNVPSNSITLMANDPLIGKGLWTVSSGNGGSFSDYSNPGSKFTGHSDSTYILIWTISNNCGISSDTVVISFDFPYQNCGIIFDSRDGNSYGTVQIGTQCWMNENLAFLPSVSPSNLSSDSKPYYYVYGYQGTYVAAAKATNSYQTYGVLYNWNASVIACPNGCHLPTDEEWKMLEGEVDSVYSYPSPEWDDLGFRGTNAGGNLKESGMKHWNSPNSGATNNSGFSALPGGFKTNSGSFDLLGTNAYFWTSISTSNLGSLGRSIGCNFSGVWREDCYKWGGFSVRCVKD